MTPETEALIARVRELDAACSVEGNNIPILLGQIADLAPQLATALEAAEKRADAAEAKLKVAREKVSKAAEFVADIPCDCYDGTIQVRLCDRCAAQAIIDTTLRTALTQLEP